MTHENLEAIKRRMAKIKAMTASPHEHEAATAQKMLAAMLAKYNIAEDELRIADGTEISKTIGFDFLADREKNVEFYERRIVGALSMLYYCSTFAEEFRHYDEVTEDYSIRDKVVIIGRQNNIDIVIDLYIEAYKQLIEEAKANPELVRGVMKARRFMDGAASRITERCRKLRHELIQHGMELEDGDFMPALVDEYKQADKDIDDWLKAQGIKLKYGGSRSVRQDASYTGGRVAGNKVAISRGIGQATSGVIKRIGN